MSRTIEKMRFHLIPLMTVVVLVILGANYPQGGKQNDQMAESAPKVENKSILDIPRVSVSNDRNQDSRPTGVSNRSSNRTSSGNSNVNNSHVSQSGSVHHPSSDQSKGAGKTRPKPEPITNKPSTPQKPTEPPDNTTPSQPSEPDPEEPNTTPDPVYVLSIETLIAEVKAIPTNEEGSLISIQVGENNNGNQTETNSSDKHEDKIEDSDESQMDHDS